MKISTLATGLLASGVLAQDSICDKYTKALLTNNTAKNQYTVLTLLVNTAVLGSAVPKPKLPGVTFPSVDGLDGILAPNATYMGKPAALAPYFSGALASSNRGGSKGVAVNFLDGGGATPLEAGKPANDMSSNQYMLLTHLYQFFGSLLKCSTQGTSDDFPAYEGHTNMYEVHKFMALNSSQVGYFISQVGLAAKSFGVSDDDVTTVGKALTSLFDMRCSPATAVLPSASPEPQAICITDDCPLSANATCSAYETVMQPMAANSSSSSSNSSMSGSGSSSPSTAPTPAPAAGAAANLVGSVVAAGGFAVLAFLL